LIGTLLKKKKTKTKTLEALQYRKIYSQFRVPYPMAHIYIGEKADNFGQSIWDKSVVLLGTHISNTLGTLGTLWELDGTQWEHLG